MNLSCIVFFLLRQNGRLWLTSPNEKRYIWLFYAVGSNLTRAVPLEKNGNFVGLSDTKQLKIENGKLKMVNYEFENYEL